MLTLPRPRVDQQGAAALAVTLLLLFVMMLGATFVNRDLLFEQRASANQYRAAQAFEAAEAGLQWAEAQLDSTQRLGPDCRPTADPAATSFRERFLLVSPTTGMIAPRTWVDAGATSALRPACVKSAAGWSCSCPADGAAVWAATSGSGPFPAFSLQFLPGSGRGVLRVVATGCSGPGSPCSPAAAPSDATARIEIALGLIGSLRTAPKAALIAGGTGNGDSFFAAFFGLDKAHWKAQPSVAQVSCHTDCTAALEQAVRDTAGIARIYIDGNLELTGRTVLGSTARPVLLVVGGDAHLRGAVEIHGALYAGSVNWTDAGAGAGAGVHGALLTESDFQGDAAATLTYDAQALGVLTGAAGSFARISGSWRDF